MQTSATLKLLYLKSLSGWPLTFCHMILWRLNSIIFIFSHYFLYYLILSFMSFLTLPWRLYQLLVISLSYMILLYVYVWSYISQLPVDLLSRICAILGEFWAVSIRIQDTTVDIATSSHSYSFYTCLLQLSQSPCLLAYLSPTPSHCHSSRCHQNITILEHVSCFKEI
jgi:hypothetical protein